LNDLPFWAHLLALLVLLLFSGFFSMSETSLMAVNRYRMRHLAANGRRGARQVMRLLSRTDRLLATILLGNNVVNAALTTIITAMAISTFGNNDEVLALATAVAAALLIVFGEIIPKVIGANRAEPVSMTASHGLLPIMFLLRPLVWVVNGFVNALLRTLRIGTTQRNSDGMTTDELRTAVLESAAFIPTHSRSILLNLFDLEGLCVDDVMIARGRIEAIDLDDDEATIAEQISTCFHNKLPVYRGDLSQIQGILHVRKAVALLTRDEFSKESLIEALAPAYYVPAGTSLFSQLKQFQDNRQQIALVVDEYGEVEGLISPQDIIEELLGEFSNQAPGVRSRALQWGDDQTVTVDGAMLVRDINRRLGLRLPIDGPKTLNGLILETLQEIPDSNLSLKVGDVAMEIVQMQDRMVRRVLLHRPLPAETEESAAADAQ